MQPWNKISIQANWRPIDFSPGQQSHLLSAEEQAYSQHYGLDFERQLEDIEHRFGFLDSGEFTLASHFFRPVNQPSLATVLIVHGYFDHAGLYGHLIDFYLKRQCSVVIFDLPGHGLSTGEPSEINDFREYSRVLGDLVDFARGSGSQPLHIIGQSTGSAIIMEYLLDNNIGEANSPFSGISLLAPLVRPAEWRKLLFSYRWLSPLVKSVRRIFMDCSHDEEFLRFLREGDPLQYHRVPTNWVGALIAWEKQFTSYEKSELTPVVIQGEEDTTIDWQHNLSVIRMKFNRPSITLLPGARHHLVNESPAIREQVFSVLAGCLPRNLPNQSKT
jgi:lysophospholipase